MRTRKARNAAQGKRYENKEGADAERGMRYKDKEGAERGKMIEFCAVALD